MSYILRLNDLDNEHVFFSYSIAYETMLSLHVFTESKHHPIHVPWVMQVRQRISPSLKEEIEAFGFLYGRPMVSFWQVTKQWTKPSFEEDIASFVNEPIDKYVRGVCSVLTGRKFTVEEFQSSKSLQEEILHNVTLKRPRSLVIVAEFIRDPHESKKRFVQFLTSYWNVVLKDDWPRIENLLVGDITMRESHLREHGIHGLLQNLAPEINVNEQGTEARIRRVSKADITFTEDDTLFLVPSYFVWPHLFVRLEKPLILNYAVSTIQDNGRPPEPATQLLNVIRSLGDMTRLQIVRMLADQPRSTRQLASLIGISESAISQHLKQLANAGVVDTRRESYYVFYYLRRIAFDELKSSIDALIRTTDPFEGIQ